jgi:hypothetical protein
MGASDAAAHEGDVDINQPTEVDMNTKVNTATAAGTAAAGTSTRPAPTTLWQRAKHGWPARYPLVQFPNVPLLVAVAGLLVAGMLLEGTGLRPRSHRHCSCHPCKAAGSTLDVT